MGDRITQVHFPSNYIQREREHYFGFHEVQPLNDGSTRLSHVQVRVSSYRIYCRYCMSINTPIGDQRQSSSGRLGSLGGSSTTHSGLPPKGLLQATRPGRPHQRLLQKSQLLSVVFKTPEAIITKSSSHLLGQGKSDEQQTSLAMHPLRPKPGILTTHSPSALLPTSALSSPLLAPHCGPSQAYSLLLLSSTSALHSSPLCSSALSLAPPPLST